MMEKCKLCSRDIKSIYHYGKCPKEKDEPFLSFKALRIEKLKGIFSSGQLYFEDGFDPAKEKEDI